MGRHRADRSIWAGAFGIAAADLTARCGTLGPAIALHFGNNLCAALIARARRHLRRAGAVHVYPRSLPGMTALMLQLAGTAIW